MGHEGIDMAAVAAIAACVALYGAISGRLTRWNITAPMVFVGLGLSMANGPTGFLELRVGAPGVATIAELTLAVVLFGDAAAVDVRQLRRDTVLPLRLLLIGLPLTILLGTVGAYLLLPGLSWWVCAVVGASVAPTDAALGAAIVNDERVPARIRRVLNVESGLNDGIATPLVTFFIAAAVAGTALEQRAENGAIGALLLGAVGGIAIGLVGRWLLDRTLHRGFGQASQRSLAVLALALLSYSLMVTVGGNGFVAAFMAGLAFGSVSRSANDPSLTFTHQSASVLSMVVWFLFGALMVPLVGDAGWREWLVALTALTVVRMVPVALATLGARLDRPTVGVIGWFGPRGLASVVFALLAIEALDTATGRQVAMVITATVLLSVVLHGVTAAPVAARYAARRTSR